MTYHEQLDYVEYDEPPTESDRSWDYDQTWDDYDSGPFCMHWRQPGNCDENCPYCGHACSAHSAFYGCEFCECSRG
jgi:hypothetical protein